jgi:hypothetical protein
LFIPDPGVKKATDPGSGSATLETTYGNLPELFVDDVQVPDRVHLPLHVGDVGVLKGAAQMEHGITGLNTHTQ